MTKVISATNPKFINKKSLLLMVDERLIIKVKTLLNRHVRKIYHSCRLTIQHVCYILVQYYHLQLILFRHLNSIYQRVFTP